MRILVMGGICSSLLNFRGPMLKAMLDRGHDVFACAGEPHLPTIQRLEAMGIPFRQVDLERRGTNFLSDLRTYRSYQKVIREIQPEVVLAYTVKPIVYGVLAAGRGGVPRVAAMITGAGATQPGTNWREKLLAVVARKLYARALRCTNVVFFQNPDDELLFRRHRLLGHSHVVQIPGSGVDLDYYWADAPDCQPITFLLIARLLINKGVKEFVEAASALQRQYGDQVRFLLVGGFEAGGGGISPSEVDQWTRSGVIEYLGQLDDVRPAIRQSSVYVLPSYREGTPRTVLEAMAMGRPVITTDVPGCRQTVAPGTTGLIVAPRDTSALHAAMERFIREPELVTTMGRESLLRARRMYDVHIVNEQILAELELH